MVCIYIEIKAGKTKGNVNGVVDVREKGSR